MALRDNYERNAAQCDERLLDLGEPLVLKSEARGCNARITRMNVVHRGYSLQSCDATSAKVISVCSPLDMSRTKSFRTLPSHTEARTNSFTEITGK